jgi:hypothetical protein
VKRPVFYLALLEVLQYALQLRLFATNYHVLVLLAIETSDDVALTVLFLQLKSSALGNDSAFGHYHDLI